MVFALSLPADRISQNTGPPFSPSAPMPSEFGHIETLLTDRFRIEALLGERGMASVFRRRI
jgi:hypothetical protein